MGLRRILVLIVALGACCAALAQPFAGRRPNGSAILPNGWAITPAGPQIQLSTLPMALELSPDGKLALTLNAGYLQPSISIIDLAGGKKVSQTPLPDAWLGLVLNQEADKLYVSGGGRGSVFAFDFGDGRLAGRTEWKAVEGDVDAQDWIGDVRLSRDGRFLYVANLLGNSVSVLNTQTGIRVGGFDVGSRPYRLRLGQGGRTLWVSQWGEASVGLYSLPDGRLLEKVAVGGLPTDMVLLERPIETSEEEGLPITARLFVACANTNSVWVLGLTEGDRVRPLERIPVGPGVEAPAGSAPTGLSLSPDGNRLYVTLSGNNAVVVLDVSGARSLPLAAFPTGWYPTAAAERPGGGVVYLSGKGAGSSPAPRGPDPTRRDRQAEYVAASQTGSMGLLPALSVELAEALTARVVANTLYDDALLGDAGAPEGNPIPTRPGEPSPIEHVILVVKENRSFDQLFGDFRSQSGKVNGDRTLQVFGPDAIPNHRGLADRFTLLDNAYTAGDVSADGQNWTAGAAANDFVEKLWPAWAARRFQANLFEGGDTAAFPPAGYLWSNCRSAGISVRNYGMFAKTIDPGLAELSNTQYPGFDLSIPDARRVDVFLNEFKALEAAGDLPRLMLVRLPNDHTAGRSEGYPTAAAMMAEHDYALGRLVEGVSASETWPKTAIFIIEDDAQDGADHVDSHRSPMLVVSPWARRGAVDKTFYSTLSVLRTIELILGLRPMTQFDAAATPLWQSFRPEADLEPYRAVRPQQPFDQLNPAGSGGRPRRAAAPKSLSDRVLADQKGPAGGSL